MRALWPGQHNQYAADRAHAPSEIAHTVCVSCYNREKEVLCGFNGKGTRPVKWAALKPTAITFTAAGKTRRVDIGLTMGYDEAKRHAERRWPDAKLLEVEIDGQIAKPAKPIRPVKSVKAVNPIWKSEKHKLVAPPADAASTAASARA